MTTSIQRSIDIQEVLENSADAMRMYIDAADHVSIYLVEGDEAVMRSYRGNPDWFVKGETRIPYPKGFTWKAIIGGKPIYCEDADKDDVIGPAGRKVGTKSYASMPIKCQGKTVGSINVRSFAKFAFGEEELRFLGIVAKQIEAALQNARLSEALRQSEERYRILFEQSPLGVFIIDKEFKITGCNDQLVRIFKSSREKIIGLEIDKLRHWTFHPIFISALKGQTANRESLYEPAESDAQVWLSVTASPLLDADAEVVGAMGVVEDITQRMQIEQDLWESKERLSYIFDNTPNVAIGSFDEQGNVLYWNNAAEKLFGFSTDEAMGKPLDQLIFDRESGKKFNSILKEVAEENKPSAPTELNFINRSGTKGAVYSTIFPIPSSDTKSEFICMNVDISELKFKEEQIRHMAMHDSLTELPNRRALQDALDRLPKDYGSSKSHAFLVMDIDNFKLINDTVGHLSGDQVLVDLAKVLRSAMRPADLLSRVGGDEFAMVIHDVSPSQARSVAERFFNIISRRTYHLKGLSYRINLSIGISLFHSDSDLQKVISSAYSALADAKFEGKNRIIVWNPKEDGRVDSDTAPRLGIRINDALRENRLVIHYQPVVGLGDGEPIYDEALVRIVDGASNIIYPKTFIGAAERFGLMTQIDRWVVETVINNLAKNGGLRTFVNLCGSSLRDESLLGFIENLLTHNKEISGHTGFEITESTTITDINRIRNWILRLKKLGCKFALDDFGTGYSSFAHLVDLPVDYVKVESSFVKSLETDPASTAILRSIISVSHLMSKEVIAEGIETKPVKGFLESLRVKYGQGNYLKPATADRTFVTRKDD